MDPSGDVPNEASKLDQPDHESSTFETTDSEPPPLPVSDSSEDLSLVNPPESSQLDSDTSALLEKDMKRKLMDMESRQKDGGAGYSSQNHRRAAYARWYIRDDTVKKRWEDER